MNEHADEDGKKSLEAPNFFFDKKEIPKSDLILHKTGKPGSVNHADRVIPADAKPNKPKQDIFLLPRFVPENSFAAGFEGLPIGDMSQSVTEMTWTIDGFFKSSYKPSASLRSPVYCFTDYCLRLVAWPNGSPSNPDCLVVELGKIGSLSKASQVFNWTIGLKGNDNVVHSSKSGVLKFDKAPPKWEFLCRGLFLSQSQLLKEKEGLASHKNLNVFCRLSIGATKMKPQLKETSVAVDTLCSNLKDLFLSGEDSDVTIKVKNKELRAHRAILRARTPVLHAMFSHDMAESNSRVISIVDCEPAAFREFLLFVYSGRAENLSDENVTSVYYVADKYDLPNLKRACVQFMRAALSPHSICDVVRLAASHGEQQLLEEATQFFAENVEDILPTVQWQRFLRENSTSANELLIKSFKTTYVKKQGNGTKSSSPQGT